MPDLESFDKSFVLSVVSGLLNSNQQKINRKNCDWSWTLCLDNILLKEVENLDAVQLSQQ